MAKMATIKRPRAGRPGPHAALLRGINVGGKNKLPMATLVGMFTQADCAEVRTYIQSGNVVFLATPAAAKHTAHLVARQIREQFGFQTPIVLRTADELRRIAANNPFLPSDADVKTLHVVFLAERPDKRRTAALDADRSPGDAFCAVGREVYLHLPNGVARTRFTNNYFDAALGTVSTMRNWRTLLRLVEMSQQLR